jgi:hypothetical protein
MSYISLLIAALVGALLVISRRHLVGVDVHPWRVILVGCWACKYRPGTTSRTQPEAYCCVPQPGASNWNVQHC